MSASAPESGRSRKVSSFGGSCHADAHCDASGGRAERSRLRRSEGPHPSRRDRALLPHRPSAVRRAHRSGTSIPRRHHQFVEDLLSDVFGFTGLARVSSRILGGRHFAVTLDGLGGRVPIVVVPPADELDRPSDHLPTDGRRRSAASAIQDWVNASEDCRWGLCSNGYRLRLVRDNQSRSRPAFIVADVRTIFEEENFADFTALWLLGHASGFGWPGTPPADCALERWREAGQKEGVAARDRLRDGVEAALLSLGNGFLVHPGNGRLRERLHSGELPLSNYFGQLL